MGAASICAVCIYTHIICIICVWCVQVRCFFPAFFTPPPRDVLILSPVFLEPGKFFFLIPSVSAPSPLVLSYTAAPSSSPSSLYSYSFLFLSQHLFRHHRILCPYIYIYIHLGAVVTAALPVLYIVILHTRSTAVRSWAVFIRVRRFHVG